MNANSNIPVFPRVANDIRIVRDTPKWWQKWLGIEPPVKNIVVDLFTKVRVVTDCKHFEVYLREQYSAPVGNPKNWEMVLSRTLAMQMQKLNAMALQYILFTKIEEGVVRNNDGSDAYPRVPDMRSKEELYYHLVFGRLYPRNEKAEQTDIVKAMEEWVRDFRQEYAKPPTYTELAAAFAISRAEAHRRAEYFRHIMND